MIQFFQMSDGRPHPSASAPMINGIGRGRAWRVDDSHVRVTCSRFTLIVPTSAGPHLTHTRGARLGSPFWTDRKRRPVHQTCLRSRVQSNFRDRLREHMYHCFRKRGSLAHPFGPLEAQDHVNWSTCGVHRGPRIRRSSDVGDQRETLPRTVTPFARFYTRRVLFQTK